MDCSFVRPQEYLGFGFSFFYQIGIDFVKDANKMHPIKHGREKEKHIAGLFLGMVCIEGLKYGV